MSGLNGFLMHEVEMPLVEVVAAMEETGYLIDTQYFTELRGRIEPQIDDLKLTINVHAQQLGLSNLNPSSAPQINTLLYDKLQCPVSKRTKAGAPSTDASTLQQFKSKHEIIDQILRFRELSKVFNSYCTIPGKTDPDGRLRCAFNQLDAATGRFASPSLIQTIPKGDEFCIRKGFRACEGFRIVKADFKQQELRLLAQVSGDRHLREAINKGIDLHGLAAVKVYGLACEPNAVEERFPKQRSAIKSIQFGVVYGRSAYSLSSTLGISGDDAKKLISDYFEQFPCVKQFIENVHKSALRDGYVDDTFGRRRYFPDLMIKPSCKRYAQMDATEKEIVRKFNAAKRASQNFVIQGASATLTKLAMIQCHRHATRKYSDDVRMILTLHDELQFEVRDTVVQEFVSELPDLMCELGLERFGFTVPMAVDIETGPSWGETSKWHGGQDVNATN